MPTASDVSIGGIMYNAVQFETALGVFQIKPGVLVPGVHPHAWNDITSGKPTTIFGYGITDAFTKTETNSAIGVAVAALVDSSPLTLDTLNELAAALGDDPNFATTITNLIGTKAPINNPLFTGKAEAENIMAGVNGKIGFRYDAGDPAFYNYMSGSGANPLTLVGGGFTGAGGQVGISFNTGANTGGVAGRKMVLLNNGCLGVATSSPVEAFEVGGSGRVFIGDGNGSNHSGLLICGNEGGSFIRMQGVNYATSAMLSMILQGSGGRVGIGTYAPTCALDVVGDIKATGEITAYAT